MNGEAILFQKKAAYFWNYIKVKIMDEMMSVCGDIGDRGVLPTNMLSMEDNIFVIIIAGEFTIRNVGKCIHWTSKLD